MHNRIIQTIDNFKRQITEGLWGSHTNPILKYGIELLECLDTFSSRLTINQQQELHDVIVIGTALNTLSRDLDKYREGLCVTDNVHYGYTGNYDLTWEGLRVISHVSSTEINTSGGIFFTAIKKLILTIGFKTLIDKDAALPNLSHFFDETSNGIAAKLVFNNILAVQLAKYYDAHYVRMNVDFDQTAFIRESILLKISKEPSKLTQFFNNKAVKSNIADMQAINSIVSENNKIALLRETQLLDYNLAKCFLQMGRGKREWVLKGFGYLDKQQPSFPIDLYAQITSYVFGLSNADTTKIIHAVQQRIKDRIAVAFFEKNPQIKQEQTQERPNSFSLLRRRK